jgi:tRNA-specific 2-thiouridylase
VGKHAGAAAYTVGQRQGLGVALGEPRYVSRIDPVSNTITLARRQDLETTRFSVERVSFVEGPDPAVGGGQRAFRAHVRIRHRARPVPATVHPATRREPARGGSWIVETEEPVWAAAPGQAAVFYEGDVVLGGGRISRT